MEEIGVVKSVEGHTAKVLVARKSICEKCTMGTCHLIEEGAEIEAFNQARASAGQKVRVTLRPLTYVKGSLIVYGIPVLALVVGAVLGKEFFAGMFPGLDPETVSAIFGFGMLLASLLVVKLWSAMVEKKTEYKPVIEEILEE